MSLVTVLVLSGCATAVPTRQIAAYGSATAELSVSAREAFDAVQRVSVERRIYDLAADPGKRPTAATFTPLLGEQRGQALAIRVQLLTQLGTYAKSLETLATTDFSSDIDTASRDLYAALSGLRSSFQTVASVPAPLDDDALARVSTAVNAIGKTIVEQQRRNALRTIIVEVDPALQKSTRLVADELGSESDLATYTRFSLDNITGSLQQSYNSKTPGSIAGRLSSLRAMHRAHVAATSSKAYFAAVSRGAREAGAAHAALRKAVERDQFETINISVAIGAISDAAKEARDFYEALQTD